MWWSVTVEKSVWVEWNLAVETEVFRENPVPIPLSLPQISHDLTWVWIQAAVLRSRWLTTCTVVWLLNPNILVALTGAVVDSMDKNGCTALHIAALYGHELLSGTLLTFHADPSKSGYEGTVLELLSCFLTQLLCMTVSSFFSSHWVFPAVYI
jgi:hypothetical protein